jgi:hypothetical protein
MRRRSGQPELTVMQCKGKETMKQIKVFLRRGIALLLSLIMLCTGMDLTAFSSFAAGVSDSSTGTNYANTLEGWHVSTLWSSTLTTDCTWNSVKREEPKQFTLQTTYRIEHPTRDYQPGEIVFRIPGIGNANRDCLVGAYSISAHEKSDHDRASDDDEWEYEWDQASDTYIFYNLFEVKQGVSTSGGFEIVFNLNSRDTENGYYQSKSPTFTLNGDDGATTITMPPLTFSYSSIRDLYYLTLTKSISGDEKESLDDAYIWKKYRTVFSLTEKSRGLYKSSYYVDITLPAGMSEEDVSVLSLSGNSYPITKTQDENGKTVYRFYPFEERYGDVSTYNYNNNEYFYLGIKKERIGQVISLHGHYDRMYKDEQTWVTTSLGDNDNVDVYDSFTLEDYGFHYEGYIYSVDKWTNGGYERQNTIDDHEAPEDPNRLLSSRLYENELVEFNVQGGARRDYGTGSSGTVISRIGNAQQATDTPAIEDHTGMTHAQIYGTTAYGGNTSDNSEIAEDGVYSMVLGDERMTIELSDGSARELRDDEYDIAYVTMPATSGTYYSYDVFGMNAKDNPSASNGTSYFDSFVCLASSNTSSTRTFRLPAGYTNVFVRINGITGSFYYTARFKMRFHVENLEGEKEIDPDGKIVNFSYLRAPHTDANGKDKNDTHVKSSDYDDGYCQNVLAGKDLANYGEYLMRDWSCVWLRSAITELSASAAIEGDDGSASNGYDVTITAAGTIKGDTEGPLNRFSLYSKIPDGFQFDIDELNLTFSGIGYYLDGTRADLDFADHVTYSTVEKDGHTWLVADFDFSDDPLLASKRTELKLVYPIHMSAMDYIEHGNNYDTTTYLMVHDDGCNISGKTVVKDGKTVGGLTSDLLDMDGDKDTEELIAYGNANKVYLETAQHWREFVSKYVKTYYTGGYATEGAVRRTESGMTDEREKQSAYTYRLDFGLGSSCAKDIWFFDSLEQGAMIAKNEDSPYIYDGIGSAWQGTFQSVDTSYAESKKMKPTVYYKLGAVYHFTDGTSLDLTGQDEKSPFEISAELGSDGTLADGWKEMDKDETTCLWTIPSADQAAAEKSGLSIAIHFDTSQMDNGMLQVKEQTYAYINMLATDDEQYDETKAVNQYYVQYVAYTGINDDNPKKTDSLPSSETYVEPMEDVGKIILDKVDGDYYTIVKGEKHYPNLTDAKFTVYRIPDAETDPSGNLTPFTNEDGSVVYLDYNNKTVVNEVNEKEVNVVGRIVIKNLSGGYYMYEETQVPVGYLAPELTEAERTFHLTGSTESGTIHIYNKRMPTKVTLRKDDKDWEEYDFIPGAEYTLTTYAGVPVYADPVSDGVYQYTENPVNNQSTDQYTTRSAAENAAEKKTGAKGTITIYGLPWEPICSRRRKHRKDMSFPRIP